jgi:hypothetical protein
MRMSRRAASVLGLALIMAGATASAQERLDRTVLPIAEPGRATYSELDARNAKAPPRFEVKAPEGAPNVVIVLIDDIGFGGPSTFGGPIRTPTMDQLAQSGLRFNNFHTTALCSPTRNALKTGRNHHTTNTGSIMETATAFPGNTGQVPNSVAPLAEMLRLNCFGGWSLYMKDGKPAYIYNFLGLERYTIAASQALSSGPATVTLDFAYDGGGVGKGGKATLYVNGKPAAEGRVEKTQPNIFSADETADVGIDNQTPVDEGIGIGPETRFTGRINKVTLDVQ